MLAGHTMVALSDPMAILVWEWADAPEAYRKLSHNGGDEDRIAFVPSAFLEKHGEPTWLSSREFGSCCVSECDVEGGRIYIGAHS